jgi:hypothetical protein
MTARLRRLAALAATAAVVLAALLATGLARVDHYAGAYGVSVGTDSAYCSLEVTSWPPFSCEAAS